MHELSSDEIPSLTSSFEVAKFYDISGNGTQRHSKEEQSRICKCLHRDVFIA